VDYSVVYGVRPVLSPVPGKPFLCTRLQTSTLTHVPRTPLAFILQGADYAGCVTATVPEGYKAC